MGTRDRGVSETADQVTGGTTITACRVRLSQTLTSIRGFEYWLIRGPVCHESSNRRVPSVPSSVVRPTYLDIWWRQNALEQGVRDGGIPMRYVPVSQNAVPAHFAPSSWDAGGCVRGGVPREGPRPQGYWPPRGRLAPRATASAKCQDIVDALH